MKKKRILHVLVSNNFSGAENVVCTLIENDDTYETFYCSKKGNIEKILEEKSINFIPLKKINPFSISKIVKKYKIDIIHAHDFKASFICALSNFHGKIISQIHCNPSFLGSKNIYTILYNIVSKKFYKIIMVSKQVLDEYYYKNNIKNKVVIIENCVDREKIIEKSKEKIIKGLFDLGYLGRLSNEKNPLEFIKIVKKVSLIHNSISAIMIGDGIMMDECKNMIKNFGLSDNIKLVGFQKNPYIYINTCKIMVMPSLVEGFGLAAIESMILGKPVINSGVGGLKNIYVNDKEFIYKDEKDAVKKIEFLLKDEDYYKMCSKKSLLLSEKYTNIKLWKDNIFMTYK